jgi:hypothetical protein
MSINILSGGQFQLAAGHYVDPAPITMTLTYPRPDIEIVNTTYHQNAYPGIRWEIPIAVQGGSWPFKYELTGSPPAGMTIGEQLTVSGDKQIVGDDYGVLSWPSPTTGAHTINVQVTDQCGTTVSVEFTLTVATTNFIFVDAINGNDTTGTGLIGAPLKTFNHGVYEDDPDANAYAGKIVIFREGTYDVDEGLDGGHQPILNSANKPIAYVGFPGETAVMDTSLGQFICQQAADCYFANLILDGTYGGVTSQAIRMTRNSSRLTFFKLEFINCLGQTGANPGCVQFTSTGIRDYITVIRCIADVTTTAPIYEGYSVHYVVIEHNINKGNIVGDTSQTFIITKGEHSFTSIRANIVNDVTAVGGVQLDIHLGTLIEQFTDIETCYNVVVVPDNDPASFVCERWNNGNGETYNTYSYRNTIISYTPDANHAYAFRDPNGGENVSWFNNVWYGANGTGIQPGEDYYSDDGGNVNATPVTDVDSSGNLIGTARTNNLGISGYEVA